MTMTEKKEPQNSSKKTGEWKNDYVYADGTTIPPSHFENDVGAKPVNLDAEGRKRQDAYIEELRKITKK